jgi:TonB family protein
MAPARRRTWLLSAGGSLAWHLFVVAPVVGRMLTSPPPPVELTYLELDDDKPEDPAARAEADPVKPPEEPQAKQAKEPDKPKPEPRKKAPEPAPELAQRKQEEKPKPAPEPPKPLEVTMMPHLKMVDQDQFPEEQDNPDARYLAQKSHRAAKDVQAAERNLVQRMEGQAPASAPSENKDERVGEKEHKVAELQDRPGDPKRLPQSAPPPTPAPAPPNQAVAKLAMVSPQQATPRAASPTPLAPEADGIQAPSAEHKPETQLSQGKKETAMGTPGLPGWSPPRLNHSDYDRIIGFDVAEAERRSAARAERSQAVGRWDRLAERQAMLRSALENFLPGVRVGNQSELGTRAHPFAAYLASVHRQIHRMWGDGFLADLDRKTSKDVYDRSLVTALELCIREDGTLERVMIARPSGRLEFDAAAIDAVQNAAPFPTPPGSIKSKDGNVYVTWLFHRDDRQCATDFVHAHILDTPPKPGAAPKSLAPAPPSRPLVASAEPARPGEGPLPLLGAPTRSPGSAPAPKASSKPAEPPSQNSDSGRAPAPSAPATTAAATTVPEEAKITAERWLVGYEGSNLRVLTSNSALPFVAGGKTVAQDGPSLRTYYEEMLGEGTPRHDKIFYFTPSQIKKRLGRLPRGGDSDEAMFALVELHSGEDLILLLEPADKGWRVIGIDR